MKPVILALCLMLGAGSAAYPEPAGITQAHAKTLSEKQKIELLIKSVDQLKGAQFGRNGSYYDGKTAASHLRLKLDKGGSDKMTAQQFIDKLASKSSMSGKIYTIRYASGKEIPAKDFFNAELKKIQEQK